MTAVVATMKTCTKCGKAQLAISFCPQRRSADGLSSQCRACRSEARRDWGARNKNRIAEYAKAWASQNPGYFSRLQKENAPVIRERARDRYARAPERAAEKRKRMYEKHREKRLAYAAKHRAENKHQRTMLQAERKARIRTATPAWADRSAIAGYYEFSEFLSTVSGVLHHVDHIVPLVSAVVCGLHCEQNLQVIPASINSQKNNRFMPAIGPQITGATL